MISLILLIGLPPIHHGSFSEGKDIELKLLRSGVNIFVEKPVSVTPPEVFKDYVAAVTKTAAQNNVVISIGYMLRYHPAVVRIREEIRKHGQPLVALSARYSCTYTNLEKPFWWNVTQSGGPIIEQATHFCDLVRYIGGEVDLKSVTGYAVPSSTTPTEPGYLTAIPKVSAYIPHKWLPFLLDELQYFAGCTRCFCSRRQDATSCYSVRLEV